VEDVAAAKIVAQFHPRAASIEQEVICRLRRIGYCEPKSSISPNISTPIPQ
jgi:hypothetical protein